MKPCGCKAFCESCGAEGGDPIIKIAKFCPLHAAAEELLEELDSIHDYYAREWKSKGVVHKSKRCKVCNLIAKASQPSK